MSSRVKAMLVALVGAALAAPVAAAAQTVVASVPIGPQPALTHPSKMVLNPANHKIYVAGDAGTIAVIDAATNTTITHIAKTNGGTYGILLNPTANQVYLLGGDIQVVDSATDTIVKTFTPAPVAGAVSFFPPMYSAGGYNPATNVLYMDETYEMASGINFVFVTEEVAIDGTTGAQLGVLATGTDPTLPFTGVSLVNPATNKVYTIASGSALTVGGYEVYDGATYARLAGSLFAPPQATDILRGYFQSFDINPADNSVWIASIVQTSVLAADGHTVLWTPARTDFYRIDGVTNRVTTYSTYGYFTGLGFDPASGRYIGTGGCIPTTADPPPSLQADPCSLTNTTGFNSENLVALDPASPNALIAVNTTGFQFTAGFTNGVSCGLGYFQFVGADVSGGNLYWSREDCTGTHPAQLIVGKADFSGVPAPGLPQSLSAQWVANLSTQVSGLSDPTPFSNMAVDPSTHHAFFLTTNENTLTAVDPAVPAVLPQLLGNTPAGLAVNSATHTVFVGDLTTKTLNVIDGATNTTRPQVQAGAGPYVGVNHATNQVVMAGPSDPAVDPGQVHGAFLLDGASGAAIRALDAAATSPIAVNPATNIAYFANGSEWYAVDLSTGARTFTGSDLSGTGADACQITGVGVNAAANQVFVSGKCQVNGQTLAVFDGATNTLLQQTNLGAFITAGSNFGFGRLAVNGKTNKVYVENIRLLNLGGTANLENPAVEVFDGATLAHLTTISGVRGQMAINTVTNVVYACAAACTAINGRTDALLGAFGVPGANQPAVAVDEAANLVYIASDRDGSGVIPGGFVNVFQGAKPNFAISGRVVNASGGVAGTTVSFAGPAGTTTAVTDADGAFAVTGLAPGSYRITPTTPAGDGFAYVPAFTALLLAGDVTGLTFTVTPAFSITGQAVDPLGAGVAGISVSITGSISATVVTDANGVFTAPGFTSGSYAVVPSTVGFVYTPASQQVTVVNGNITGVRIVVSPTFSIGGQVVDPLGAGRPGLTVAITGPANALVVTDAAGQFTAPHLPPGVYNVTASGGGFFYTPASQAVTIVNANITGVVFTAAPTFTISGQVVDPLGAGLPGMTVTSQGAVTATAVTDAVGQFTLAGFPAGTYTIVPATPAFQFTPALQSVTVAGAAVTGVSFTAVPTFNISGQVLNTNGTGLSGVTVTAQGGVIATTVTGANGQFTLAGFPAGTYTITPIAAGVIFGPSSQSLKVAKADITGVTFSVIPPIAISSYTLSPYTTIGPGVVTTGTIVLNQPAPSGGVTIALSASDAKPAKFPSTVTVAQGQTSASFAVQGNSVSAATSTTLKASYQGTLAPLGTSATAGLTVAPSDTLHVTKATWSSSTNILTVTATSTNAQAIIAVLNANGNVPLGTMTNLGNGTYTFQITIASLSSVSIKSNLGGSTGQGVSVIQ